MYRYLGVFCRTFNSFCSRLSYALPKKTERLVGIAGGRHQEFISRYSDAGRMNLCFPSTFSVGIALMKMG